MSDKDDVLFYKSISTNTTEEEFLFLANNIKNLLLLLTVMDITNKRS